MTPLVRVILTVEAPCCNEVLINKQRVKTEEEKKIPQHHNFMCGSRFLLKPDLHYTEGRPGLHPRLRR